MKELKTKYDNMNKNFKKILNSAHPATQETFHRFSNSENTESVSGSSQESGVSHAVRDRNANGEDSPQELEPVAEALEIRTEGEKYCPAMGHYGGLKPKGKCDNCGEYW